MWIKRFRLINIALAVLVLLVVPLVVTASSPVAGHKSERKVILIGGYDTKNNADIPLMSNRDFVHTRRNEFSGWQKIIDYLVINPGVKPTVSTENELVKKIGLTSDDIFIFDYSGRY